MTKQPESPTPAAKKPRRRLTDEERIAEREAEIARIKHARKMRAAGAMEQAKALLLEAIKLAEASGMEKEVSAWSNAAQMLDLVDKD